MSEPLEQDPGLALRKTSLQAWGRERGQRLAEGTRPHTGALLTALILMAQGEQR